jgi:nucleotide-binding universal stress UspA family protein
MIRIDTLLFASDFTPCSDQALPLACDLAALTGASLHALHVASGDRGDAGPGTPAGDEVLAARLQALVEQERLRDRWAAHRPLSVKGEVVHQRAVAPAIVAAARRCNVDLIVMGTHGRRGLRRLMLGSVATEVVRYADRPVLTVGGREAPYDGTIRSILVPVDFSIYARQALRHARELAAFFGARVDLLHVLDAHIHPTFYNAGVFSLNDLIPDADRKAAAHLEQFYRETDGPVDAVRTEVVTGVPATEIVDYARRARTDLILLSTHGLTGLEHFLIGSVAEKVVRTAPCPVLTVKAFGHTLLRPSPDEVVEEIDLIEG